MTRLRIARDADTDLLEIWTYHAERSQASAGRIVRGISAKYDTLLAFPGMGRKRDDIGIDYRSFPVGDYIIYYRVFEDGVEISRVLHGSRDTANVFAQEPLDDTSSEG